MATTNSEGTIALWNLNERLLIGQKVAAHSGKIYSVFFLLGQPNMITCGEDNKIARWFMETEISLPVPSKVIEGHKGEVNIHYLTQLFPVLGHRDQVCY
jgi:U3 small nucleolar RNA-associated protein 21